MRRAVASYSDIGSDPNDAAPRFVDIRNTTRTHADRREDHQMIFFESHEP